MKKPTEKQITDYLESVDPEPSDDFHDRMERMPWNQPEIIPFPQRERAAEEVTPKPNRRLLIAALVALLLGGAALAFPTVRAAAGEALRYFTRSEVDEFVVTLPATTVQGTPNLAAPTDTVDYTALAASIEAAGQSGEVRSMSYGTYHDDMLLHDRGIGQGYLLTDEYTPEEAAEVAGFSTALPTAAPAAVEFAGAFAMPGSLALNYQGEGWVSILINPIDAAHDGPFSTGASGFFGEVAASAAVLTLEIEPGVSAEYVSGWWNVDNLQSSDEGTIIEVRWDPDAPLQMLRWEQDDLRYQLMAFGERLRLEDLVEMAASID